MQRIRVVMYRFRLLKYLAWTILPMAIVSVLMGCDEPGFGLGGIESEIDACQWAVVHHAAGELKISPVKESMEAVIEVLKAHSEHWAQEAGLFLETVELADKEVEDAVIAHNSDKALLARSHIDSAIWLLRSALKETERLGFNPNLGNMDTHKINQAIGNQIHPFMRVIKKFTHGNGAGCLLPKDFEVAVVLRSKGIFDKEWPVLFQLFHQIDGFNRRQ